MVQFLSSFADVSYSYTTTTTSSSSSLGAGFWISYVIFLVAIYLVAGFALGKTFKKAGRPLWPAFVPIYNTYVMFELGGQNGAAIFWALLPFIGSIIFLVYYIKAALEIAKRFGKSPVFAIFGLFFFSLIGYIILGFGKSTYQGPDAPGQGPIGPGGTPAPFTPFTPAAPVAPQAPEVHAPQPPQTPQQPPTTPVV